MSRTVLMRTIFVTFVVFSSTFTLAYLHPLNTHQVSESYPSQNQLDNAAFYLLSMYNPKLGLVANSEDEGPNPIKDPVPCNRTYWGYSDNLWAGYALRPFYPEIADNVTATVQRYIANFGWPMLFEVAIGEQIPTLIHDGKDIKVYDEYVNGSRVQVLLDRHQPQDNPGIFLDADEYADLCFYMTINYWMMEDITASEHWFRTGEDLWNYTTKKGFYDKTARQDGRYQNFKLGLFLLAQKVTEFESNITEEVEVAAWRYQNALGGITTQSWLNGSLYGTANAETTSSLLLAYNDQLINRLHSRQNLVDTWPYWFTIILILTFFTGVIITRLYLRKIRQRS